MRQAISAAASLLLLVCGFVSRGAESTWEFSVQVSASVDSVPPTIRLSWPQDTYLLPNSYTVFRKTPAATSWGQGTALPGTSTGFIDTNVTVGSVYEYQIVKKTSQYTGYGYLYSGIEAPLIENRGKLLLIVDNTYAASLTNELARLQEDLVGDGSRRRWLDGGSPGRQPR
jgi:hypothetical protein